ncbi:hypothetical protein SBRCBS47491_008867 [Sporothrix bragantina]|uniref:Xylanolytic transcriptional activator regulatory domain-containing protein n=1 Tax=Sporothrix bragantina TaxID=671064 RepID=A0ABP0CQ06_9PEZI
MVRKMWQIYCNSINPLTKLLHVPTVQKMVDSAVSDTASLSRASEALLFAIYAAAVMSLQEDICHDTLGEQRSVLLPQYLATTEAALARAGVLGTSDMVVLQAFLVYLLAVRDRYTPRAVWTLTGVAMRIAKSMGLDRDGQSSGLSPFDIEMRRRLWWQLRMHDFRTAELCGRPKFEGLVEMDSPVLSNMSSFPTQWPANVNDADLSPDMPGPPFPPLGEASTATDAIFVAVKCELLRFTAQRLAKMQRSRDQNESPWTLYSSLAEDGNLQTLENHLETRYLRYCDPSRPLHLMATLMVRCALNILRFMARHPRRPLPETSDDDRRTTFNLCLAILDQQNLLQSNPHLRTFAWHAPFFQQWHALLHVLDTLRADPSMGQATRAWDLLGKTYANNAEMQTPRKTVHIVVVGLDWEQWDTWLGTVQ